MTSSGIENPLLDFENQLSPYYTEQHKKYRLHVRKLMQQQQVKWSKKIDEWYKVGKAPKESIKEIVKEYVNHGGCYLFPFGMMNATWNGNKYDPFYEIIFHQEISKGCNDLGTHTGIAIGMDPLVYYGKHPIHKKVLNECKNGDKMLSLAISEMSGGSDVASITTTAKLSDDGENYIINGTKYWITAAMYADYFVTLVRTGPKSMGRNAVTLILIPRGKGVFTSQIKLQGKNLSGTASVTFANVIVPKTNVIGKINNGFIPLMLNFNLERFGIACGAVSYSMVCVSEAIKWAQERKTFGKKLIKHQVIRHKIADMTRKVMACQALLEKIAYQLKYDPHMKKDKSIARNVALLKVQCTETFQYCTIEASQIFGGRSYVRGGRGAKIDKLYRAVRAFSIYGGSAEIMKDLALRQAKL